MYDGRLNLSRQVAEETKSHFGERVYNTVIGRNVKLGEAPSFGKPIILYDIQSRGAVAYLRLGEEVLANVTLAEPPRRPPPLPAGLAALGTSQPGGETP